MESPQQPPEGVSWGYSLIFIIEPLNIDSLEEWSTHPSTMVRTKVKDSGRVRARIGVRVRVRGRVNVNVRVTCM